MTSLTRADWEAILAELGEPAFRAGQILDWIYRKRVVVFEAMLNLPAALRAKLAERVPQEPLAYTRHTGSADTTRKFLFRLGDGRFIETVLIPSSPALYGEKSDRRTLCVSSQVGCAFDCKFCASGLAGFTRNLTAGEIVGQVLEVERHSREKINNLVFMGMGEPLANLPNLLKAIEIINAPWGIGLGARHLTISTSGLAPMIRKLAEFPLQVRLAVSLHGATNEVRDLIMPVNKRFPLEELFDSLQYFTQRKKQKITFEYILIDGVNDSLEQAARLVRHARALDAKVNLIPYNTVEGLPWKRPSETHCERFRAVIHRGGVPVTLRREKGHDIDAACGQLRLMEEAKMTNGE